MVHVVITFCIYIGGPACGGDIRSTSENSLTNQIAPTKIAVCLTICLREREGNGYRSLFINVIFRQGWKMMSLLLLSPIL